MDRDARAGYVPCSPRTSTPHPFVALLDQPSVLAIPDHETIRRVLADAKRTGNYDNAELRDIVSQFGADARSADVPPERVLIWIKQLVDEYSRDGVSQWWRSVMTDRAVRWAVEGYYRIDLDTPDASKGGPP